MYAMYSDSLGEYYNLRSGILTSVYSLNKPEYFMSGFVVRDFFVMKEKFLWAWSRAKDWRPVTKKNFMGS